MTRLDEIKKRYEKIKITHQAIEELAAQIHNELIQIFPERACQEKFVHPVAADIEWLINRVEKLHEALDQIWRIQAKNFHGNDNSSIMADVARAALEEE